MRYLVVWAKSGLWQVIDTQDNCKVVLGSESCRECQSMRDTLNNEQKEIVA
jgi:hypothetical protein